MFIVTAHIPKKKLLVGAATLICCAAVVVTALLLTAENRAVTAAAETSSIRTNDDRVAYLNKLGWQVSQEPVSAEELLIPDTFDESYTDYLALQAGQGFDLTRYCGKQIKRYSYQILSGSTEQDGLLAVLLVYRNRIIGGQIQSLDGTVLQELSGANKSRPTTAPQAI